MEGEDDLAEHGEPANSCSKVACFNLKGVGPSRYRGYLEAWDLVTTYNWAYNPTCNLPERGYRGYPSYK